MGKFAIDQKIGHDNTTMSTNGLHYGEIAKMSYIVVTFEMACSQTRIEVRINTYCWNCLYHVREDMMSGYE